MRRRLSLINKPFLETARQTLGRIVGVVTVVANGFAGQQHVQHVMAIVVPLGIEAAREMPGGIVVVFQDEMKLAFKRDGAAHFGGHLLEPIGFGYGVYGIEAQSIEVIFDEPVEYVVSEEALYFVTAEIDRRSPRRR